MQQENFGIQTEANPDRNLEVEFKGSKYSRYPIRTRLVNIGDDYIEVIEQFAIPHAQEGDLLVFSEKMIGICQERVVHGDTVNETWLAKLITRFVIKYPDDVGWENPKKVQVAIDQVGYPRTVLAVVVGGIMKFLFRRSGWYYKIMGRDVAAIDGFNPIAIPPFNNYALLAPANPNEVCQEVEDKFGFASVIVDASNIATEILGRSSGVKYSDQELKGILEGNPMGQEDEQTPILIVRETV